MLWEGGWEWTRLAKSKYISIEITCLSSLFSLLSSLFSLYLFLINILFLAGRVRTTPTRLPPLCHFRSENLHSVRGYPKKVEKTSSKNTTFEISEHPYRTCGCSGAVFVFFDFPIFDQKPIIPFVAVPKKSKKRQAKTRFLNYVSFLS